MRRRDSRLSAAAGNNTGDNESSCPVASCPPAVPAGYRQVRKQPHSLERAVQKQKYLPDSNTTT